ncbi:hypothetical protein DSC45_33190 [Streptomyces sp. YIM 130001]|uniref:hypothetical protein n=1 Tax=Streptomyces sp. YIM 130001 TaxID=2259644 RepID=UPI000EEB8F3F|nr:hypothetical protein [Streptomyces sp. YIM 130001]RII08573.1 hypothetical protein DSC45_33190 [Streptomyces sp. YIM 130001]
MGIGTRPPAQDGGIRQSAGHEERRRVRTTRVTGGLLAIVGALAALYVWVVSRRTDVHLGGGFEGEGEDLSVLWTELPLVVLAGALVPAGAWLLARRVLPLRARPAAGLLVAAAVALAGAALLLWGLDAWTSTGASTRPEGP